MIKIIHNDLDEQYAVPLDHPLTCANPAPWKIIECRIETNPLKIWIRGEGSMWFRADQCWINTLDECEMFIEFRKMKNVEACN